MHGRPLILAAMVLGLASDVGAQVTRVATFENFAEGQAGSVSFTDPVSGIHFRDSTHPGGGFTIDYSTFYFGGSTYLTAGGWGPGPSGAFLGSYFGFTGDLPAPADRVGLDVVYEGGPSALVVLQGFDAHGVAVTPAVNRASVPSPFHLEVTSAEYDIVTFRVSVGAGAAGYDNVSYTVLPEPSSLAYLIVISGIGLVRRR